MSIVPVVEQATAIVGTASSSYIRRRKTNPNLAKTQLEYISDMAKKTQ